MNEPDKMFVVKHFGGKPSVMMVIKQDEESFLAIDPCGNTMRGANKLLVRPATIEDCAKQFIQDCKSAAIDCYDF